MADRLAVVVVGDDDALHLMYEEPGSTSWSAWVPLGAPPGERPIMPTLTSVPGGRLDLYAFSSTTRGMWRRCQVAPLGAWDDWVRQPDPPGVTWHEGNIAVCPAQDGSLQMFCVNGTDRPPPLAQPSNKVWHRHQKSVDRPWSRWRQVGQPPDAEEIQLLMESNSDGRLELVAAVHTPHVGERFETWRIRERPRGGGWTHWEPADAPTAPGHGYLSKCLLRGQDGRLVRFGMGFESVDVGVSTQAVPGGDWQPWVSLGKPADGPVWAMAAVVDPAGGLTVISEVGEMDWEGPHQVWCRYRGLGGDWSDWLSLGAPPAGIDSSGAELALAHSPGGRTHLLATAMDGAVWGRSRPAGRGTWSPWASIGAPGTTSRIWMPTVHPA